MQSNYYTNDLINAVLLPLRGTAGHGIINTDNNDKNDTEVIRNGKHPHM